LLLSVGVALAAAASSAAFPARTALPSAALLAVPQAAKADIASISTIVQINFRPRFVISLFTPMSVFIDYHSHVILMTIVACPDQLSMHFLCQNLIQTKRIEFSCNWIRQPFFSKDGNVSARNRRISDPVKHINSYSYQKN
jgi:hypothetical protein